MTGEKKSLEPRCPAPSAQSQEHCPPPQSAAGAGWQAAPPCSTANSFSIQHSPAWVSQSPETALAKNKMVPHVLRSEPKCPSTPLHPRNHPLLQKLFPPSSPAQVGITDLLLVPS